MNTVSTDEVSARVESKGPSAASPALPSAAISVMESALELVRAEAKLALAEAKKVGLRWLAGAVWGLISLLLLPVAVAVLALGTLLQPSPPTPLSLVALLTPTVLLLLSLTATYVSLRKGN